MYIIVKAEQLVSSKRLRAHLAEVPKKNKDVIRAGLLSDTIRQSDKTSLRVGKKHWRLGFFHHADSAIFVAAPSAPRSHMSHPRRETAINAGLKMDA